MRVLDKLIVFIVSFLLMACSSITPSENFKQFRQINIGKNIEDKSSEIARYPWRIVRKSLLENGNLEYAFDWYGSCKYFYEVDAQSLVIIKWRAVGLVDDCIIPN